MLNWLRTDDPQPGAVASTLDRLLAGEVPVRESMRHHPFPLPPQDSGWVLELPGRERPELPDHVLLDVDGAFAPVWGNGVALPPGVDTWPAWADPLGIPVATGVIEAVHRWRRDGAEVCWLSTWEQSANSRFTRTVGMPALKWLDATTDRADGTWPKLGSALDVAGGVGRLVWIDDHHVDHFETVDRLRETGVPVLLVCPHTNVGLTPRLVERIDAFLRV